MDGAPPPGSLRPTTRYFAKRQVPNDLVPSCAPRATLAPPPASLFAAPAAHLAEFRAALAAVGAAAAKPNDAVLFCGGRCGANDAAEAKRAAFVVCVMHGAIERAAQAHRASVALCGSSSARSNATVRVRQPGYREKKLR